MRSESYAPYMMSVASSCVPPAATALPIATCAVLVVCVWDSSPFAAVRLEPRISIDVAFVVLRDIPLSASKNNSSCFGTAPARLVFF